MKSREFAGVLRPAGALAFDEAARRALDHLADAFERAGNGTVAGTLKLAVPASSADDGVSTAALIPHMKRLQALLAVAGKTTVVKDFDDTLRLLEKHDRIAFAQTKARAAPKPRRTAASDKPIDAERVNRYEGRLTATLGDETGFAAVYQDLQEDAEMRPGELRELSRRFAGVAGKTRADALKKIMARQQNVLSVRAKARATAGRSAA